MERAAAATGRELMLPLSDASDEDAKRSSGGIAGDGGGGMSLTPFSGLRKPRGRPKGSKNKPKPPVVITRESEAAMRPAILEFPAGSDILECVAAFSRCKRLGVSLLSGSGAVQNLSLRHPASRSSTISFPGRFEILSVSGTFLPPETTQARGAAAGTVTLSVAGGLQGQVIGGAVAGPLTAAEAVVLVVATFASPEFYRLPIPTEGGDRRRDEEEGEEDVKPEVAGGRGGFVVASAADMVLWRTPPRAPGPHSHRAPPPNDHHY